MTRHTLLLAALLASGVAVQAQPPTTSLSDKLKAMALCDTCGTVQSVQNEKRKGKGGAAGVIAGAAVGGLLGNQVGKGTGNTVATVGGAVAGGVIGNEVQKRMNSKTVWVTEVKMKDGTVRKFEQEAQPAWAAGNVVKVDAQGHLSKQ